MCKTPGLDGREARADQPALPREERAREPVPAGRHYFSVGGRFSASDATASATATAASVGGLNCDNADELLGRVRAHDTCVPGRSTGLDVEMTPCMALEDLWS